MTIDDRLTAQQNSAATVSQFITELTNGKYDLDNIVDNGILPEDTETDISREDKMKYFTELAYLLIDETNFENATFETGGRYFVKGLHKAFNGVPPDSPNFIIGTVYFDDPDINQYLNFEFVFRLFGWFVYKDLDYDDDDTREQAHKFWLDTKKLRYPDGIPKVKVKVNKKAIVGGSEDTFNKAKKNFKEYGKYENPFLKKFKKQMKSDGNTEKLSLMHFGNMGDYVPTNLQEQRELRTAQNTREQFQKDIGTRVSMLMEHFIFATSIILIPFIYFPNTEEMMKLACMAEYPGAGASVETSNACKEARGKDRSSSNFIYRLLMYNQAEIIRFTKAVPYAPILIGFAYLMNSRLLLYFETATEWQVLWGSISMVVFLIYLAFQVICIHPKPHSQTIGCCIRRRLWSGNEQLLWIIAMVLTAILTPLFLVAFYTFGKVYPFVIAMIDILGYNPVEEGKRRFKVYENNDGRTAKKIFLACACVFLILLTSEITACFNDYYNSDLLKYSSLILNWITYILGIVMPIVLVIVGVSMDNPKKHIPKAADASPCGDGKCRFEDLKGADVAIKEKAEAAGAIAGAGPGAAAEEVGLPQHDPEHNEKLARLEADNKVEVANIWAGALGNLSNLSNLFGPSQPNDNK